MSAPPPNLSRLSVKAVGDANVIPLSVFDTVPHKEGPDYNYSAFNGFPTWYVSNKNLNPAKPIEFFFSWMFYENGETTPPVPRAVRIRLEYEEDGVPCDIFTNLLECENFYNQTDGVPLEFRQPDGTITYGDDRNVMDEYLDPFLSSPPLLITVDDGERNRILKCSAVLLPPSPRPPPMFEFQWNRTTRFSSSPTSSGLLLVKLIDTSASPFHTMYGVDYVPPDAFFVSNQYPLVPKFPIGSTDWTIMVESRIRKLVLTCPGFDIPKLRRHLYFMPGGQGARDAEESWAKAMPKSTQESETQVSGEQIDQRGPKRLRPIQQWQEGQSNQPVVAD